MQHTFSLGSANFHVASAGSVGAVFASRLGGVGR